MKAVNSIVGWQFPVSTIRSDLASEPPRLLTLDFDFPSSKPCNLRCRYCFIETDERQNHSNNPATGRKLTVVELKNVFREAAALGCRSAKLVGDQESFQEPEFLPFVEHVSEDLGMWLVVFTNAIILANEERCRRIHGMGVSEVIKRLKDLRVSIMVKFHSFDAVVEDGLVGRNGFSKERDVVLQRLMDAGFNNPPSFRSAEEQTVMTGIGQEQKPERWTRLGLESVISPQCLEEAEAIYRLKAAKRLFVDLDPPVPVGLTESRWSRSRCGMDVEPEEMLALCKRLYELNEELGIPYEGPSPYFGGAPCSQLPYGLYVNALGRIYPCCGCPATDANGQSDCLRDAREPLALRSAIMQNPYRLHYKQKGFAYDSAPFNSPDYSGFGIYHGCPFRDRAGDIMPPNWDARVHDFVLRGFRTTNEHCTVKLGRKTTGVSL